MADPNLLQSALHRAADRGTWRQGVRAAIFLALAVVAAVGSALLLTRYMEARTAAARVPTQDVVVAAADLPIGTELVAQQLKVVAWPMASVPQGTIADPAGLVGKLVSVRMYAGEPILPVKLAGGDTSGLSALLPPGMRAAAVKVDDVVGVAGFIHPGDRVDVIATLRGEGNNATVTSKVVLQDIRVLAVGKELDAHGKPGDRTQTATVATLMVDADQSERLALAAAQGKILLTLRSPGDTIVVDTKGARAASLLAETSPEPTPSPPAPPPPSRPRPKLAAAPPPPRPQVVEILRGDLYEKRDFQGKDTKEAKP